MKSSIQYCGKDEHDRYIHFYNHESLVKMCGCNQIFKVRIRECLENETNTHWSWWDNEDETFNYTHYNKMGVTICFPYDYKIYEKNGDGLLIPVVVELI